MDVGVHGGWGAAAGAPLLWERTLRALSERQLPAQFFSTGFQNPAAAEQIRSNKKTRSIEHRSFIHAQAF